MTEGPFDPDEILRWADTYGHPEEWAKRAQAADAEAEKWERLFHEVKWDRSNVELERDRYETALGRIASAGHSNSQKACNVCVQIADRALNPDD